MEEFTFLGDFICKSCDVHSYLYKYKIKKKTVYPKWYCKMNDNFPKFANKWELSRGFFGWATHMCFRSATYPQNGLIIIMFTETCKKCSTFLYKFCRNFCRNFFLTNKLIQNSSKSTYIHYLIVKYLIIIKANKNKTNMHSLKEPTDRVTSLTRKVVFTIKKKVVNLHFTKLYSWLSSK